MRRSVRAAGIAAVLLGALAGSGGTARANTPNVLLVGSYNSATGPYTTIQAAVNAAQPGDWILVGPGDYHERADYADPTHPAGVAIATAGLHLRGMDRNTVVVDGTKPTASTDVLGRARRPGPRTARRPRPQRHRGLRPDRRGQQRVDREPHGLQLPHRQLLAATATRSGGTVGDGGGHVNMDGYTGNYLTATSTYSNYVNYPAGSYGIFVATQPTAAGRMTTPATWPTPPTTSAPASRCATRHEPRPRPGRRPVPVEHERRWLPPRREHRVRPEQDRAGEQRPEQRRLALPSARRLPDRGTGPLPAASRVMHGVGAQLPPRQQQPQRSRQWHLAAWRAEGRWAPGPSSPAPRTSPSTTTPSATTARGASWWWTCPTRSRRPRALRTATEAR